MAAQEVLDYYVKKEWSGAIPYAVQSYVMANIDYAFQDINDIPGTLPEGRTKPWGTGQAVLAAKNVIKTPFIVINADDYYGKEGFKAVHEYLVNGGKSCMAGFVLKNTLSDNGGVTRGICKMDEQNNLTEVVETKNIVKTATGAEADGVVVDVYGRVYKNLSMRGHSEIFLYQTDCPQSSSHQIALLWGQFYTLRGMGGALSSVRPRI